CPSCADVMAKLQSIIQKLNGLTVNSCQAAKDITNLATGLVPDTISNSVDAAASKVASGLGIVDDALPGWLPSMNNNQRPAHAVSQTTKQELKDTGAIGNIVWSAMQKASVAGWWSGGDPNLLESILSVTGSVIIRVPDDPESDVSVTPL